MWFNTRQFERLSRRSVRAVMTGQELAAASSAVVQRRVAIGAAALASPSSAALREATRMTTEKLPALAMSGLPALRVGVEMAEATVAFAASELAAFAAGVGRLPSCKTPGGLVALQARLSAEFAGRLARHGLILAGLAQSAGIAALKPLHAAAHANALRLTR